MKRPKPFARSLAIYETLKSFACANLAIKEFIAGGSITKVFRKDNKLVIIVPYDVVSDLGIKDGDDVDFLRYNDKTYIFAKKNDLMNAVTGGRGKEAAAVVPKSGKRAVSLEELSVLKKLDTLRYTNRTKENVRKLLNQRENDVLHGLLMDRVVTLYKKDGEGDYHFSIPKEIYNEFLFGKREKGKPNILEHVQEAREWETKLKEQNKYADELEKKGYIVIPTEAEATTLSTLLEESIRLGLIIGTRAFNKKYYVVLKGFVTQNATRILKVIDNKSTNVAEIAKAAKLDEDAARAVLYLLAEGGDVTEVRRDVFRAA